MRRLTRLGRWLLDALFGWLAVLGLWLWLACMQVALFAAFSPTMRPGFRLVLLWSLPLATLVVVLGGSLKLWRVRRATRRRRG